jgi:peroxiredoxin
MTLIEPRHAFARVEAFGGGLRDAGWLVVVGILCFRLEDMMRALLGITHLSWSTVVRQMLAVVSYEVLEVMWVVLGAAVVITLAAGRGRRDPSRDLELGGVVYVPYFAVRAIFRTLDLPSFYGPLPSATSAIFTALAFLFACLYVGMAIAVARRRPVRSPDSALAMAVPAAEPIPPRTRSRLTVALLAAMLGAAFFINLGFVVRNADAIRPLRRGHPAPSFSLPRLDGQPGQVSLTDLKGKVVLLDFWASWCQPCVHMLPTLHRLHEEWHSRGVEFVGINSDGPAATRAELEAFVSAQHFPYPVVIDGDGEVGGQYKVVALPHIVVVGRDGQVRRTFWGVTSAREIAGALAQEAEQQ